MTNAQLLAARKHLKAAEDLLANASPNTPEGALYSQLSDLIGEVEELAEERSAPRPILGGN